nr:unnamed protein product [Spirometra erinaceieuropaei]
MQLEQIKEDVTINCISKVQQCFFTSSGSTLSVFGTFGEKHFSTSCSAGVIANIECSDPPSTRIVSLLVTFSSGQSDLMVWTGSQVVSVQKLPMENSKQFLLSASFSACGNYLFAIYDDVVAHEVFVKIYSLPIATWETQLGAFETDADTSAQGEPLNNPQLANVTSRLQLKWPSGVAGSAAKNLSAALKLAENYFTTVAPRSLLSPDLNAHTLSAEHLEAIRLKFAQSLCLRTQRSNGLEVTDEVCSADDTDDGGRGGTAHRTDVGTANSCSTTTDAEQVASLKVPHRRHGREFSTLSSRSQTQTQIMEDASDTDVKTHLDRLADSQAQATALLVQFNNGQRRRIPTLCFSSPVPSYSTTVNTPSDSTFLAVYWSPDSHLFLYELRKDSQVAHLACVNSNRGPVRSLDVVYTPQQHSAHIIGTSFASRDEEGEGSLEEVEFFQLGLRLSAVGSVRRTAQSTVSVVPKHTSFVPTAFHRLTSGARSSLVLALFGKDGQLSIAQLGPSPTPNDSSPCPTSCVLSELASGQFRPVSLNSEFTWPPKECILVPKARDSESFVEDDEQPISRLWIHGVEEDDGAPEGTQCSDLYFADISLKFEESDMVKTSAAEDSRTPVSSIHSLANRLLRGTLINE